ncbi:hypothetical protein [Bombiscardovia coagulans]|nr:hypothetical protein [Bombiscardovia coagulans]
MTNENLIREWYEELDINDFRYLHIRVVMENGDIFCNKLSPMSDDDYAVGVSVDNEKLPLEIPILMRSCAEKFVRYSFTGIPKPVQRLTNWEPCLGVQEVSLVYDEREWTVINLEDACPGDAVVINNCRYSVQSAPDQGHITIRTYPQCVVEVSCDAVTVALRPISTPLIPANPGFYMNKDQSIWMYTRYRKWWCLAGENDSTEQVAPDDITPICFKQTATPPFETTDAIPDSAQVEFYKCKKGKIWMRTQYKNWYVLNAWNRPVKVKPDKPTNYMPLRRVTPVQVEKQREQKIGRI